jgi:hypothetical protein
METTKHTAVNPLKLMWSDNQYKVNKPGDQSGEFVSKEIADIMRFQLEQAKVVIEIIDPENPAVKQIEEAIRKATE